MNKFEECKKEWLKNKNDEEILRNEIIGKVKIILDEQKEIGYYFLFPRHEKIDTVKRYHWFFYRVESKSELKCPCCNSNKISASYIHLGCDYLDVYECSTCDYFAVYHHNTQFPNFTIHSYLSSLQSLRKFNFQLDRHI